MQAIIEDGEFNAYRRSICPETRFRADEHALSTHHESKKLSFQLIG